ncbi:hypothetical protein JOD45_000054 [Scopulibacillus daqui]|uniref:Uncharacterized protein n=1 Tax=Scopulibacillus daqui TaxID=1469162 RepID=A0ABS2PUY3_9BACL|nr:hypothetical protein [Scopulibacillus daqui]MBM7643863.1 hypothetical protein [Scopulibacillus daqui]
MWIRWIGYIISTFFSVTAALLVIFQGYNIGDAFIDFLREFFQNKS